jgi:hypothetical protein
MTEYSFVVTMETKCVLKAGHIQTEGMFKNLVMLNVTNTNKHCSHRFFSMCALTHKYYANVKPMVMKM